MPPSSPRTIPRKCGHCRACGVMRSVIEDAMMQLGRKLSVDELLTLSGILKRVNTGE